MKKNTAISVAVLVTALYSAGGFFGVPFAVQKALQNYAPEYLARQVTTEKIAFNPFTLRLNIRNLTMTERDKKTPFITLKELDAAASWMSILKFAPLVDHISLDTFNINILRQDMLRFNVTDLLERYVLASNTNQSTATKGDGLKLPGFSVKQISLKNSALYFSDRVRHKKDIIDAVNFDLPLITSFKEDVSTPIAPRLAFRLNGEPFDIKMQSIPFHESMKTGVNFSFTNLDLANLATFVPLKLNVALDKAQLDATVNVAFTQTTKTPMLRLKGTGLFHDAILSNHHEKASDSRLLNFKSVKVDVEELFPFHQTAKVASVTVANPSVSIVRERDGSINWLTLVDNPVKGKNPFASTGTSSQSSNSWKWSIDTVKLENATVELTDRETTFNEKLHIGSMVVGPIEHTLKGQTHLTTSIDFLKGKTTIESSLHLSPLKADSTFNVAGLDLSRLNPVVGHFTKAKIDSGLVNINGKASYDSHGVIRTKGNTGIQQFSLTEKKGSKLLSFEKLAFSDFDVEKSDRIYAKVKEVVFAKPFANALISKDGVFNWSRALNAEGTSKQAKSQEKAPQGKEAKTPTPLFSIDKVIVTDAAARYLDVSVKPVVRTDLKRVRVTTNHLANTGNTRARFVAQGNLNSSRIKITGSGVPKNGDIDIVAKVALDTLMLPTLSAYSDRYTGHAIQRGNLSYLGECKIEKNTVDMSNQMVIDQLEFKDATPNAETTYPMPLVAALLRDRLGKIELDIPVYGSFDDPDFSIAGTVFRVIGNLIVKAATSPFSLISSLVGGGNVDLSTVAFTAGRFDAASLDVKTADALIKVLTERPGLNVRLIGGASAETDGPLLKANVLTRMCREERKLDPKEELTEKDRRRAIENLFDDVEDEKKPDTDDIKMIENYLLSRIEVKPEWLNALSLERATVLRNHLVTTGKVDAKRIFVNNENCGTNTVKVEIQ